MKCIKCDDRKKRGKEIGKLISRYIWCLWMTSWIVIGLSFATYTSSILLRGFFISVVIFAIMFIFLIGVSVGEDKQKEKEVIKNGRK